MRVALIPPRMGCAMVEQEDTMGTSGDAAPRGDGDFTKEQVLEALKGVQDPELGINIVDLGLVYEVTIDDGAVHVQYTLTTMGCPIGPMIEAQIQEVVGTLPRFESLTTEMVLRPAWSPEMMSDEAKAALGVV